MRMSMRHETNADTRPKAKRTHLGVPAYRRIVERDVIAIGAFLVVVSSTPVAAIVFVLATVDAIHQRVALVRTQCRQQIAEPVNVITPHQFNQ